MSLPPGLCATLADLPLPLLWTGTGTGTIAGAPPPSLSLSSPSTYCCNSTYHVRLQHAKQSSWPRSCHLLACTGSTAHAHGWDDPRRHSSRAPGYASCHPQPTGASCSCERQAPGKETHTYVRATEREHAPTYPTTCTTPGEHHPGPLTDSPIYLPNCSCHHVEIGHSVLTQRRPQISPPEDEQTRGTEPVLIAPSALGPTRAADNIMLR